MHTNSNRQEPTTTTADVAEVVAPQSAATVEETPAKPAATKPTTAKKPAASKPTSRRPAQKPAGKSSPKAKPAGKAPSTPPAPTSAGNGPREGSTMWAILQVLGSASEPLSAKAVYAEIAERKLAPGLKGKTPDQTVAAKLAVSAKRGEYVERAAPGKFQLLTEQS